LGPADRCVGDGAERVLRIDPEALGVRNHAKCRAAGEFGESVQARSKQFDITAELVDHEPRNQLLVFGFQYRDGAEKVREHAAAIDIADHKHRQLPRLRQPHVRQIRCTQVDLGGRTGPFTDHHIEFRTQRGEFGGNDLP
jgi:hypothetical protein